MRSVVSLEVALIALTIGCSDGDTIAPSGNASSTGVGGQGGEGGTGGAGTNQWLELGPSGGDVYGIYVDPNAPSVLWAATTAGAFRSTDLGATWERRGLENRWVWSFVFRGPGQLIATTYQDFYGLFQSTDDGATWQALEPGGFGIGTAIYEIAVDPQNPDVLFGSTSIFDAPVVRSDDGGSTWTATVGQPALDFGFTLLADRDGGRIICGGAGVNGGWTSLDGGMSWNPIADLPGEVNGLSDHPTSNDEYYAATTMGVFHGTNDGATWAELGASPGTVWSVAADPAAPTSLLVGSLNGAYESTDGGATFQGPFLASLSVESTAWSMGSGFLGTRFEGVYRRTGPGMFAPSNEGLRGKDARAVWLDPENAERVVAGVWTGILVSDDGGSSWTMAQGGVEQLAVLGLTQDPSDPKTVWAATSGDGVWVSFDSGATWEKRSSGMVDQWIHEVAVDPADPNRLLAAVVYGLGPYGYRSLDRGMTWTPIPSIDGYTNTVAFSNAGRAFFGSVFGLGVYASDDGGATFTKVALEGEDVLSLSSAKTQDGAELILAGGTNGLWKSSDGGASFQPIFSDASVYHLTSSNDGSVVYAALWGSDMMMGSGGVRVSVDWSNTFTDHQSAGLGDDKIADARWIVAREDALDRPYIATRTRGILKFDPE
jgi:hypothetical protein